MSIIVERLDNAIMRGDIATPAWVVNTMLAAREHIAKLEAHITTDNSAVIATLEARIALLEAALVWIEDACGNSGMCRCGRPTGTQALKVHAAKALLQEQGDD